MRSKLVNSQLTNWQTYNYYKRRMLVLAESVFVFEDVPELIDVPYINKILIKEGSIAFFKDEVLGVLALPYTSVGNLDVYGRPLTIEVYGKNNYKKILHHGEYVIMYDNVGKYPLYIDICQSAERMALIKRVTDINVSQQKTPRIWKTSQDKVSSLKALINDIDGNVETVTAYNNSLLDDDTTCVLEPAPYVSDKLDLRRENEWNEFLQLIGISNLTVAKRERNISDEVKASMGGTIASRFSRYEPRKTAIDEINKKFNIDIKVKFYDGMPDMIENIEKGDDIDDMDGEFIDSES